MSTERPLRIAHIAPVATEVPPLKSGSVELMTSLLTEGLVAKGQDVTLFATADSKTKAKLHAIYQQGYWHDENMWPWELYEMLNLAAAVERAAEFDIIHYEAAYYPMSLAFARLSSTPIVQTLHHSPSAAEVGLWSRYPEAPFVAISNEQARLLSGVNVVGTVLHGIDTAGSVSRAARRLSVVSRPFYRGQGVLQAPRWRGGWECAWCPRRRKRPITASTSHRTWMAARSSTRRTDLREDRVRRRTRALRSIPGHSARCRPGDGVRHSAAALDPRAVREVVDDGITGGVFDDPTP